MKTLFTTREAVFEGLAKQPGGTSQKSRADRVRWMLDRRTRWVPFFPFADRKAFLPLAGEAMADGMYSKNTIRVDVAGSLKRHAHLAYACIKFDIQP